MTLREYLQNFKYKDLVFDFINLKVLTECGYPILIIAPTGGGKTVLIKSLGNRLEKEGWIVRVLERISPLRMLALQEDILNQNALFLSEDFSTIGHDDDATYKSSMMVAKLSYDKRYIDPLFATKKYPDGLQMYVKKLGFLCGLQPLWLAIYVNKTVFQTLIQEKILRYYRLPISTIKHTDKMDTVVNYLENLELKPQKNDYYLDNYWYEMLRESLQIQTGVRASEYIKPIMEKLKTYIPENIIKEWIKQLSLRMSFEAFIFTQYYSTANATVPQTEVLFKEYSVLFYSLWFNPLRFKELGLNMKIRGRGGHKSKQTRQWISKLVKFAQDVNFIFCVSGKKNKIIIPTEDFRDLSINIWRVGNAEFKGRSEDEYGLTIAKRR